MRWDLRNGVTLCYPCHMFTVHRYSVWVDLAPLFELLTNRLGLINMLDLDRLHSKPDADWCDEDWLGMKLNELKGELL